MKDECVRSEEISTSFLQTLDLYIIIPNTNSKSSLVEARRNPPKTGYTLSRQLDNWIVCSNWKTGRYKKVELRTIIIQVSLNINLTICGLQSRNTVHKQESNFKGLHFLLIIIVIVTAIRSAIYLICNGNFHTPTALKTSTTCRLTLFYRCVRVERDFVS